MAKKVRRRGVREIAKRNRGIKERKGRERRDRVRELRREGNRD